MHAETYREGCRRRDLPELVDGASREPFLSDREETELLRAAACGDEAAREQLVRADLRVVVDEAIRHRATACAPVREAMARTVSCG